ncbi:MAG: hypothetical protein ACRDBQ_12440 [Shewanella sp.]
MYKFIANGTPEIEEGQRYNIGYFIDDNGDKIIELSALSKKYRSKSNYQPSFFEGAFKRKS